MVFDPVISESERQQELTAKLATFSQGQEERLASVKAEQLGLPYINLVVFPIDSDVLERISKQDAQAAQVALFYKQGADIRVGAVDPQSAGAQEVAKKVEQTMGYVPHMYVVSNRSIAAALARYRRDAALDTAPQDELKIGQKEADAFATELKNLQDLGLRITSMPPTEILSAIVISAVRLRASDIHVEPKEKEARLRFRIDGVLQDVATFDRQGWALILSRVKVMARLKLNVRDVPQDGSFVLRIGDETYDMRLSTLPGGSGETTTLASFLREVNNAELKIITLEDPIEYRIPGVEQTQVDADAGYSFAIGLRSILRQDPDMIMVGEMRDVETAETAVHAALTGHLVFSTLHTNDAAGAIPRLVDMGIKPYVLAPSLNLVIAQRLVRVLCPSCAQEYEPDETVRTRIIAAMKGVREDIFNPNILQDASLRFARAVGCGACANTGYRGRLGAFEIFPVQDTMKELILSGASSQDIQRVALEGGMTTIAQDGYLKVIDRKTTLEEVERVSQE